MPRKPHLAYLDVIAGIAILRIVLLHAKSDYLITGLGGSDLLVGQSLGMRLLDSLLRFSVPIFLMISGVKYGLREEIRDLHSYGTYLGKRVDRIVRPYLGVTLLVLGLGQLGFWLRGRGVPVMGRPTTDWVSLVRSLASIRSPAYQLWFLVMLILVSAVYPLIRGLVRRGWGIPLLALLDVVLFWSRPGVPWRHFRYLLIYHLGVRLGECHQEQGRLPGSVAMRGTVALTAVASGTARALLVEGIGADAARLLYEVTLPLALVLLLEGRSRSRLAAWFEALGHQAWPIYLFHAPYILGQLGLLLWRGLEWRSPWAILPLGIASLILAAGAGELIRRTPLRRFLL